MKDYFVPSNEAGHGSFPLFLTCKKIGENVMYKECRR